MDLAFQLIQMLLLQDHIDHFDEKGLNYVPFAGAAYIFSDIYNVGIDKEFQDETLKIFPNPSKGSISIQFEKEHKEISITQFSLTGQEIQHFQFQNSQVIKLELSGPTGIYLLKIRRSSSVDYVKVIKN